MSLFMQYNLAQAIGDLGDAGGGWSAGDAASQGFGFAMGAMMPYLIWQNMARQGWGPSSYRPHPGPPHHGWGAPQPRFCGQCGAPLVPQARFCGHCGTAAMR